jgi:hypothetical protein
MLAPPDTTAASGSSTNNKSRFANSLSKEYLIHVTIMSVGAISRIDWRARAGFEMNQDDKLNNWNDFVSSHHIDLRHVPLF